ncbi:hypothetical protein NQZ68_040282 [Dissostichus eleginoides]|nr:hypothetical protein NQZ68_040282 [Dissostichus eleginoides]
MERVCFTFPSLELEESTGAVSGSPKTTQSQRVPVLMPNNSPTSPPPTHNQIRVDQTSPTSHRPPGSSLSGAAAAPSRNHSQEHTGPQLVLRCRSQNIKRPSSLLQQESGPCGGMGDAGGRSETGGVEVVVVGY